MYYICPISGSKVSFSFSFPFENGTIYHYHPIFSFPLDQLYKMVDFILTDEATEKEAALIFLAILFNTGLVKFNNPAAPNLVIIRKSIEALVNLSKLVQICKKQNNKFYNSLPKYVVSKEANNQNLDNIDSYLESLKMAVLNTGDVDLVNEFSDPCFSIWERLQNSAWSTPAQKAILVAKFVQRIIKDDTSTKLNHVIPNYIKGNSVKTTRKELWIDIIKAPADRVNFIVPAEVDCIEAYLADKIPLGTTQSQLIFQHLKSLKDASFLNDDYLDDVINAIPTSLVASIEILGNGPIKNVYLSNLINTKNELMGTPKPEEKDFPSKAKFIIAMSKWQYANRTMPK